MSPCQQPTVVPPASLIPDVMHTPIKVAPTSVGFMKQHSLYRSYVTTAPFIPKSATQLQVRNLLSPDILEVDFCQYQCLTIF
jgi:hypothetical protein